MRFLYDKRVEPNLPWVKFPWENEFNRGFESDIVRVLGYSLHATGNQVYFNPDGTFVEVA